MDAEQIAAVLIAYGLRVVGAVIILVIGWLAAGWIGRTVRRILSRSARTDQTIVRFFASLARYAVLAFVIIAVLDRFGVQTASLVALLGVTGLAVGLAMQGALSNLAAGVMLLMFRPFRVGQYVEVAGQAGTVEEVNLFVTELTTPDNVQIIIPNGAVWGSSVVNYSHHPTRRVDFTIGISYTDDIDEAISVVRATLDQDARTLEEPEPQIVVGALGDSSVDIIVRVWANAGDYWPLKFDLTKAFKERLEEKGITIPFPQREVHVVREHGDGQREEVSA